MKISVRTILVIVLLLAAIGYTIYNWITGQVDSDGAILYILVLGFPLVRMLSAALNRWKASQE